MSDKTLYDKLWESHVVNELDDSTTLLYIDKHLLHEVTTPQAFAGLANAKRPVWRVAANLAVMDHNVPTDESETRTINDPIAKLQLDTLNENCKNHEIPLFNMQDKRQGIVHVIGPEQGATLPGMTLVCGDSHTSTHGALGALAFGIGTSEVEHVLATQCLRLRKLKNMQVRVSGTLRVGVSAKDLVLAIIGKIGCDGGAGHALEFVGEGISALSIEARMTLCNMAIEAGARCGLVAVDDKTIEYVKGRPFAPTSEHWQQAILSWQSLHSDNNAHFDKIVALDASQIVPQVTWGTSPEMVMPISGVIPDPKDCDNAIKSAHMKNALDYMGLNPGTAMCDIALDKVFIGSCTNSRIEDLRMAAAVVKDKKIATTIKQAMVVPGSGLVKAQAEAEGLADIFIAAGFEWRQPGCSMCIAMNADKLEPLERCASTSNRNFEGRQGKGGRTHLVSPAMAAAAAIEGRFVDVRAL